MQLLLVLQSWGVALVAWPVLSVRMPMTVNVGMTHAQWNECMLERMTWDVSDVWFLSVSIAVSTLSSAQTGFVCRQRSSSRWQGTKRA